MHAGSVIRSLLEHRCSLLLLRQGRGRREIPETDNSARAPEVEPVTLTLRFVNSWVPQYELLCTVFFHALLVSRKPVTAVPCTRRMSVSFNTCKTNKSLLHHPGRRCFGLRSRRSRCLDLFGARCHNSVLDRPVGISEKIAT